MNVLDLFSGIGGFSLGLERAGMRTVAFCEIDPYCRAVLRKHWPAVPVFGDIRILTARDLADAFGKGQLQSEGSLGKERQWPGLVCGGFPCQDISYAGKGAGLDGARSGLWSEFARIVGEVRPKYVIVENVAALLGRGLGSVLGDLAALGYDAEWHCIPACAVGAPHRRDRIWIVADADGFDGNRRASWVGSRFFDAETSKADDWRGYRSANVQWLTEPDVGRVAHGVPSRVDRLRGLGNAVVPQITEIIGRAIVAHAGLTSGTTLSAGFTIRPISNASAS